MYLDKYYTEDLKAKKYQPYLKIEVRVGKELESYIFHTAKNVI
jgi:hypothetical protein